MDIFSQPPRLPLLDLQTQSPTRPSGAISEVLGTRERVDAIVRQVVRVDGSGPSNPRTGPQQAQDLYRVVLQVENRNIEALINRPLQAGQQLSIRLAPNQQVQVVAIDGRPVTDAGTQQTNTASRPATIVEQLASVLRQNLPRQESSAGLLRNLQEILRPAVQTGSAPAAAVPKGAETAAQSAAALASAVQTAAATGIRNESHVAGTPAAPPPASPAATSAPLNQAAATAIPRLPANVQTALVRLIASLPTTSQVSEARGLQAAIRDSGIFLEPKLANLVRHQRNDSAPPPPAALSTSTGSATLNDQKANLLRFYATLESAARQQLAPAQRGGPPLTPEQALRVLSAAVSRSGGAATQATASGTPAATPTHLADPLHLAFPTPVSVQGAVPTMPAGGTLDLALSVLLRQVAAAISRITVQQVQSTAAQQGASPDAGVNNSWQIEIPIRHADGSLHAFQIQIDEEEHQRAGEEEDENKVKQWKVTLAFDLDPLGPMYAQIRLRDHAVSTRFWAEREATLQAVRSELDALKTKLVSLGLQVEELDCLPGAPPSRKTTFSQQLVDIRT